MSTVVSVASLASAAAVTAANPVAAAALRAPLEPRLDPETRALLEELLSDLDGAKWLIRECGFVPIWKPGTSEVYFSNPRYVHLAAPGWVPLAKDADARIRALLSSGGFAHG
jgi:hypothetical protein